MFKCTSKFSYLRLVTFYVDLNVYLNQLWYLQLVRIQGYEFLTMCKKSSGMAFGVISMTSVAKMV